MVYFVREPGVKRREGKHDLGARCESVLRNISSLERKLSSEGLSEERKRSYLFQLQKLERCCEKLLRAIASAEHAE